MSNGPAIAAPSVISIAITTPPSSKGLTIQLSPRSAIVAIRFSRPLQAIHRAQHPLEHQPHVIVGPGASARATRLRASPSSRNRCLGARRPLKMPSLDHSAASSCCQSVGGRDRLATGEVAADVGGGCAVDRLHRGDERQPFRERIAGARRRPTAKSQTAGTARQRAPELRHDGSRRIVADRDHDLLNAGERRRERRRHHRHGAAHLLEPLAEQLQRPLDRDRFHAGSSTRCDSVSRFITDTELAVGSAPS